jgi:hypothetical protein
MKNISILISLIFISFCGMAQQKNFIDQPYLEVTGSADSLVTPNEIFIKILIAEKDTKDKVSVEDLEIKMVNALKALEIDLDKNLSTNDISSNFKSYLLKNKDILKTKQYTLKVNDGLTVSKVFINLEQLGISNTSIEKITHSNLENIKNTIRTKAVENAKTRALAIVKPLKQNIGPAIQISDNGPYFMSQQIQGRAAGIILRGPNPLQEATQAGIPKIEFEKINVTANIQVKFILK